MKKKPTISELEAILNSKDGGPINIEPDGSIRCETFREGIERMINCHSKENGSNTPDFVLAAYLDDCLSAFDRALHERERWYGRPFAEPAVPRDIGEPTQPNSAPSSEVREKITD